MSEQETGGVELSSVTVDAVARAVGDGYVAALRRQRSVLVADRDAERMRRESATRMVVDVLHDLGYVFDRPSATSDPWAVIQGVRSEGAPAGAAWDGALLRAVVTVRVLLREFSPDPGDLLAAVMGRSWVEPACVLGLLERSKALDELTVEVIYPERLREVGLTAQEETVFALMVDGADSPQIASTLSIAVKTAKNHGTKIASKFGVRGRHGVLRRARQLGVLTLIPAVLMGASGADASGLLGSLLG
jgi:DNA-binding CsgD family transcriptional regulator